MAHTTWRFKTPQLLTTLGLAGLAVLAACADPVTGVRPAGVRRVVQCDPTGCPPPPAPTPTLFAYGMNANYLAAGYVPGETDQDFGRVVDWLAFGRVRWVRVSVNWYEAQDSGQPCTAPPNQTFQWATVDKTVDTATHAGLHVLGVLAYPPLTEIQNSCNNTGNAVYAFPPTDTVHWKNFVQAAVSHFGGRITYWNIWNEINNDDPSTGSFRLPPGWTRAQTYADLINSAAPIIHAAGGKVVALEVNGIADPLHPEFRALADSVMQLAGNNIDIASIHQYGIDSASVINAVNAASASIGQTPGGSPSAGNVWITEAGDATNDDSTDVDGQASRLQSLLFTSLAAQSGVAPALTGFFYWHAWEGHNHDPYTRGILTGVGTGNVQPKHAWDWYRAFMNMRLTHHAHIAVQGWQPWTFENNTSGQPGSGLDVEAFQISPKNLPNYVGIQYRAFRMWTGWEQQWVQNGATAGTTGEAQPLGGFEVQLQNAPPGMHVCYQAYMANRGWQGAVCDGAAAGLPFQGVNMEAMTVWIVTD